MPLRLALLASLPVPADHRAFLKYQSVGAVGSVLHNQLARARGIEPSVSSRRAQMQGAAGVYLSGLRSPVAESGRQGDARLRPHIFHLCLQS